MADPVLLEARPSSRSDSKVPLGLRPPARQAQVRDQERTIYAGVQASRVHAHFDLVLTQILVRARRGAAPCVHVQRKAHAVEMGRECARVRRTKVKAQTVALRPRQTASSDRPAVEEMHRLTAAGVLSGRLAARRAVCCELESQLKMAHSLPCVGADQPQGAGLSRLRGREAHRFAVQSGVRVAQKLMPVALAKVEQLLARACRVERRRHGAHDLPRALVPRGCEGEAAPRVVVRRVARVELRTAEAAAAGGVSLKALAKHSDGSTAEEEAARGLQCADSECRVRSIGEGRPTARKVLAVGCHLDRYGLAAVARRRKARETRVQRLVRGVHGGSSGAAKATEVSGAPFEAPGVEPYVCAARRRTKRG